MRGSVRVGASPRAWAVAMIRMRAHLVLNVREALREHLVGRRLRLALGLAHGEGGGAVRVREVARDLLRDAVLLHELHVEQLVVAVAAHELDALGDAWAHLGDTTEVLLLDDTVDELLSHCTVLRTTETHART